MSIFCKAGAYVVAVFLFSFSVQAKPEAKKPVSPKACLEALNTKSVSLKGKIVLLDNEGYTYVLKKDDGSFRVVGNDGSTYTLTSKPTKCQASQGYNQVEILQGLINQATALGNDSSNSSENKKAIVSSCKDFMNLPAGQMMSNGSPSFPGDTPPGQR